MNHQSLATIDRIVQQSAMELFAAYHVDLDSGRSDAADNPDIFSATLGFTNPLMRGAIIITLNRDLVARSLPSQIKVTDAEMVADWTGELANQLLGRIKKQLFQYGLEIVLSTPVVFRGKSFDHFSPQSLVCRTLCLGRGADSLELVFQADVQPGFELVAVAGADTSLAEGDISLF